MAYTFLQKKNNAYSTLNGSIINTSGSVTLTSAALFPTSAPFVCTIWNNISYPDPSLDPNMEIVAVIGVASNVFTITRAQENTLASSHASGSAIQLLLTVGQLVEHESQINSKATPFRMAFTNATLSSGILTANHGLGQQIVNVQVYDNTNSVIIPDGVVATDSNNVTVNLTSFGTISGTYNIIITG